MHLQLLRLTPLCNTYNSNDYFNNLLLPSYTIQTRPLQSLCTASWPLMAWRIINNNIAQRPMSAFLAGRVVQHPAENVPRSFSSVISSLITIMMIILFIINTPTRGMTWRAHRRGIWGAVAPAPLIIGRGRDSLVPRPHKCIFIFNIEAVVGRGSRGVIAGERTKKIIASENLLRDPRFRCWIDTVNDDWWRAIWHCRPCYTPFVLHRVQLI